MALPCCKSVEISRVRKLATELFKRDYLQKGVPIVIEGAIEHWPARQWTLDSLLEKAGDNVVNVRANTDCEDYRSGKKYNIRKTTFREYVADIKADNKRARNSYLAVQNLKKAFPQLLDDIEVPDYVGKLHGGPFLWVARKGHYEYCHFDPDDGLLYMLQGRKLVRLFGCDMTHMYPNDLGSKGRTIQSQVDCNDPDLDLHPAFRDAQCFYTTLHPGEILYIPAFWWHQVTSLDQAISINMFFGDGGENTYLTKIMKPPQWSAFSHWLLNIIEQNRNCESFKRTLARLPVALHNFLITQWHDVADDQQVETLVSLVTEYLGIEKLPEDTSTSKHPPPLQIRGLLWRN